MKKYFILITILVVVSGMFQTLQSLIHYQALNAILDESIYVRAAPEPDILRQNIIDKAYEKAIFMVPSQIEIEFTQNEPPTQTTQKDPSEPKPVHQRLVLDLYYQAQIFYYPKPYILHREHSYTSSP